MVRLEAQLFIGLYRIAALVLQLVRLQLRHQANASAFLLFIKQHARARLGNHLQGHLQLLAAVTAQRAENIAGKALRMDTHQRRRRVNVTHHQGNGFFFARSGALAKLAFKTHDAEVSPACGKIGFCHFAKIEIRAHVSIIVVGCIMNWNADIIRVAANGINFEVATMGTGDKLALCLHGFPEHAYSWRHQMPMLARLGYRVWAPNLRGYGNTDSPQDVSAYKTRTLVQDVAALIQAANAKETVLMAHDWGGVLAWALAMSQPQLMSKLIILNLPHPACFARELRKPHQLSKSWYIYFFQLPWLPELLLGRNKGRATSAVFRKTSRNPAKFPDEVLEVYRANAARPGGLTAMLNWYRALMRGGGLGRMNHSGPPVIEVPTLFLWGDADAALSFATTHGTEKYVADLTFRVFPGVSHWIQQEAPDEVNAMIEAWLSGKHVPEYSELAAQSH